jgi:CRP-like cAMP-binding protein
MPTPRTALDIEHLLAATFPWCKATTTKALAPLFRAAIIGKGAVLLPQGGRFTQSILVVDGCLRLYFTRRDGREFNKNFFTQGIVWPVTHAMQNDPSLFGIAALEISHVWRADSADIRSVLERHGEWQITQSKTLAFMVTQKLQREHDLLALDGRQRYERFLERHPQLAKRIPLSQLATYLGVTDVSLSRIRRSLRKR